MKKNKMSLNNNNALVLSAVFLAIALVLPFFTGQIPLIGKALSPMHIPVILCGFLCGPWYALCTGFTAPLFRFLLFGAPPVIPAGIAMCFELSVYGFLSGFLYRIFPTEKKYIYLSLVCAMIAGRIVWGSVRCVLYGLGKSDFGWSAFVAGAFINAIPGIVLQIIVIPVIVMILKKP